MKQKIVIKVHMPCQGCRSKAMEIAVSFEGVISVAIEGKDLDQLVVIGDGVDVACLIKCLRKKVGCADIVSIEEVKPKPPKPPSPPKCPRTCQCLVICSGECPPPCTGKRPHPCTGKCPPPCTGKCRPPCTGECPPPCTGTCQQNPFFSASVCETGPSCSIM